jgi:hypothetical protein
VPKRCCFCGGIAGSREHVWPKWIGGVIEVESAAHTVIGWEGEGPLRQWNKAPFTTTCRAVCHDCNVGWMSRLESRCKPFLTPLFLGHPFALDREGQGLVAAWCLKTAAMLDRSLGGEPTVYTPHLEYLREQGRPPPTVQVSLGTYPATVHVARFHRAGTARLTARNPDFGVEAGTFYGMTLAVGRLIIQVAGHTLQRVPFALRHMALEGHLLYVWPFESEIVWPPPPLP